MEHTDELSIIGYLENLDLQVVMSTGAFYVHRCCFEFSPPFHVASSDDDPEQAEESRIKIIISTSLLRKCAFCLRHGASIPCKVRYFEIIATIIVLRIAMLI